MRKNLDTIGLILGIGFFSGLLVLMKQTVGLLIPPVSLISLLWICMQKEYKKRDYIRSLILLVVGIVIGLVPGFVYLLKNDIFNDFYLCMLSAADSKIVDTSMIQLAFRNFIRIDELICALSIILCVMLIRKYSIQKEPVYCLLSVAIVLLALWNEFVNSIKGLKEGIRLGNFLECVALMMILMIALYLIDIQMKKNNVKFALDYILGVLITTFFLLVVFVEHYLTQDIAIILYDGIDFGVLKKNLLYVGIYITIFIWIKILLKCFLGKEEIIKKIFIPFTIFLLYLGTSFLSATLEEIFAILFVPIVIVYCLEFVIKKNIGKCGITIACFMICFCCLSQKLYIPYDWHEWRTPSLLSKENNIQKSDIDGLEGYYLSESDKTSYKEIINSIINNSSEDEVLFQFSSIPLFNVLSQRRSVYAAIPYFDVCPDNLAIRTAEELEEELPKLVLFDEMSEWRWVLHEEVFRSSNVSGQRAILDFYNDYVQKYYRLLGAYDNNVGEVVCLWKRTAYNGGIADNTVILGSENILKQNIQFTQNEFDTIAIQKIEQEDLIGKELQFILKNTVSDDIVMDKTVVINEIEDNYYVYKVGPHIVNSNDIYELSILNREEEKCYLGSSLDEKNNLLISTGNRRNDYTLSIVFD